MKQVMMTLRPAIGLLIAALAAVAHAGDGCSSLKPVGAYYRLHQTNGFGVVLRIAKASGGEPASPAVTVLAWQNKEPEGPMKVPPDGRGNGVLGTRDGLRVTVHWSDGTVGVYTANVKTLRHGFRLVDGETHDAVNPESQATWASNDRLICAG